MNNSFIQVRGPSNFSSTTAPLQQALAAIDGRMYKNQVMKNQAAKLDMEKAREADRVAAVKLGNDRLQQYKDIVSTPAVLGKDIGLDASQANAQANLSDNINRVFNEQTGNAYDNAFANSVAGTSYGTVDALQKAAIAGDATAIDLMEDAQWQAGAKQDAKMEQLKLTTPDLDKMLTGSNAVQAMSTPTIEQKYNAMLDKTTDPVVRKQIVDTFGGEVATAQGIKAAAATERGKRADEMVKEQSKLLREFTGYSSGSGSGRGKPSTSDLGKVMTNLGMDVTNWSDDDQRAVFGMSQDLANKKGYENIDTDAYFADAMRRGKEITGEWMSSSNKVDDPEALKTYVDKEIAADIKAGRAKTVKAGKGAYKGMGYNTALKAQQKIFTDADTMRTTSGRLASTNTAVNNAFAPYAVSDAEIKSRIEGLNTAKAPTNSDTDANRIGGLTAAPGSYLDNLSEVESYGGDYTAVNSTTGAYGRYQILPSTAKDYIGKDGITASNWKTPEMQDKIFNKINNANRDGLNSAGIKSTQLNMYGAHQQGLTGYKEIVNYLKDTADGKRVDTLSTARLENIRNNLPNSSGISDTDLPQAWMDHYSKKFSNKGSYRELTPNKANTSGEYFPSTPKADDAPSDTFDPNPYNRVRQESLNEFNRLEGDTSISPMSRAAGQLFQRGKSTAADIGEIGATGMRYLDNAGTAVGNLFRADPAPYMTQDDAFKWFDGQATNQVASKKLTSDSLANSKLTQPADTFTVASASTPSTIIELSKGLSNGAETLTNAIDPNKLKSLPITLDGSTNYGSGAHGYEKAIEHLNTWWKGPSQSDFPKTRERQDATFLQLRTIADGLDNVEKAKVKQSPAYKSLRSPQKRDIDILLNR